MSQGPHGLHKLCQTGLDLHHKQSTSVLIMHFCFLFVALNGGQVNVNLKVIIKIKCLPWSNTFFKLGMNIVSVNLL